MALKIIGPNKDVASWAVLNFISARICLPNAGMGSGCIFVKYEYNTLFDYLIGISSSEI